MIITTWPSTTKKLTISDNVKDIYIRQAIEKLCVMIVTEQNKAISRSRFMKHKHTYYMLVDK